ncbi:MAG TPA: hypothetical protein VNM66_09125 [Thermodesulfobacteriota bacterium]|nr:hypothetical protein [Thermodesulfobacteriota bacterium]
MVESLRRGRRVPGILAAAALLGLLTLSAPGAARADAVGDPTLTTGTGRLGFGVQFDLSERDLDPPGELETVRLLGTASFGFAPNVDGFLKAGLVNGDDLDLGFGLGAGLRASLLRQGDWQVGGLVQLVYFLTETDPFGLDTDWIEFDLAGAVSFRGAGALVPYAGIKIGLLEGDVEGRDFDQDDPVGVFGGVSVAVSRNLTVGAELRLINEDGIAVFVNARF